MGVAGFNSLLNIRVCIQHNTEKDRQGNYSCRRCCSSGTRFLAAVRLVALSHISVHRTDELTQRAAWRYEVLCMPYCSAAVFIDSIESTQRVRSRVGVAVI